VRAFCCICCVAHVVRCAFTFTLILCLHSCWTRLFSTAPPFVVTLPPHVVSTRFALLLLVVTNVAAVYFHRLPSYVVPLLLLVRCSVPRCVRCCLCCIAFVVHTFARLPTDVVATVCRLRCRLRWISFVTLSLRLRLLRVYVDCPFTLWLLFVGCALPRCCSSVGLFVALPLFALPVGWCPFRCTLTLLCCCVVYRYVGFG